MKRIARIADKAFAADQNAQGDNVTVLGVQHPAEG